VLVAARELAAPSAASGRSAAAPGTAAARPSAPMRLTFRAGQRSVQWSDHIGARETDAYVLFIARAQLVEVRLDRVRGRDVVLRVLDHRTGRPVDAAAGAGARTWTGRMPAAADYRIEVARTIDPAAAPTPYMLIVTYK
jgi:hypothetical protein